MFSSIGQGVMLDQSVRADGGLSRPAPLADAGAQSRRVLSPAQFKAALYAKGWTMRLLADYWGLSADYVRRFVGDPQRAPWWDNAVLGLPIVGPARKPRLSWSGESELASVLAGLMRPAELGAGAVLRRPKGAGFRYWGYMVLGAVVAVAKHLGEMADEGMHGVVVQVIRERTQERYRVVFETGGVEMFSPDLVDEYLVTTGIERNGLVGYIWRGEEVVRQDFEAGMFVFEGAEV